MARLFITSREIAFINDINKELIKDIMGQYIYYYAVDFERTKIHPVYQEAVKKVFKAPIKLDCLVGQPKKESTADIFGSATDTTLELFVQARDLIDKDIKISEGDFFTYGDSAFEIVSFVQMSNLYGQEEYENGYKMIAKTVSSDVFNPKDFNVPSVDAKEFADSDVEKTWSQQRGMPVTPNNEPTNDIRQMRERLGSDMAPIALGEGPREIVLDDEKPDEGNQFDNESTPFIYSDD
jgi:hypothetical protein